MGPVDLQMITSLHQFLDISDAVELICIYWIVTVVISPLEIKATFRETKSDVSEFNENNDSRSND